MESLPKMEPSSFLSSQAKELEIENKSTKVISIEEIENSWDVTEDFEKVVQTIEDKIDKDAIVSQKKALADTVEEGKEECFPSEKQWNDKINGMIKELQEHDSNKKQIMKSFIREIESEYNKDRKDYIKASDKAILIEAQAIKFMSLSMTALQKLHQFDHHVEKIFEGIIEASEGECSWLKLAVEAFNTRMRANIIKEYSSLLAQRVKELEKNPSEKKRIEQEIFLLEKAIETLKAEQKEKTKHLIEEFLKETCNACSGVLGSVSENVIKTAAEKSVNLINDIAITGATFTLAGSLISISFNVYHCIGNSEKLHYISRNIATLKNEVQETNDPYKHMILSAKIDRLENLKKEYEIKLFQNALETVASLLAISISVKGILSAAGVSLIGASSVFFTATGIGAVALGGGLTIGGTAYKVYRNQHHIKYYAKTFDIPLKKHLTKKQIKKEISRESEYQQQFKALEEQLNTLQTLIPLAEKTLEQISHADAQETKERISLAQRQIIDLTDILNNTIEEISHKNIDLLKTHDSFIRLQDKLKELDARLEIAKEKRYEKELIRKFSKYNIYTLSAMKSIFQAGLSHQETANKIKELLVSHGFEVRGKIAFGDIIDFIIEDEKVTKKELKPKIK